jgi:hypothetical protein
VGIKKRGKDFSFLNLFEMKTRPEKEDKVPNLSFAIHNSLLLDIIQHCNCHKEQKLIAVPVWIR